MGRFLRTIAAITATGGLLFATGAAVAKEVVKLAYVLEASSAASVYAIESKKVTSDLIDVQIEYLGIQAIDQAPSTGQYDILQTATLSVPRAVLRGLPIKALAVTLRSAPESLGSTIWVPKDSPYKSISDLKNKTIGAIGLNSSALNNLRLSIYKKTGLNVSYDGGDFTWVEVPSNAMAAALQSGRIDAATFLTAQAQEYQKSGEFRPLFHGNRELFEAFNAQLPSGMLIAYTDRLNAKPEVYKEFLRLIRASLKYLHDNPSEVFAAVGESHKLSPEAVKTAFFLAGERPFTITDEDYKALGLAWSGYKDIGILKEVPPVADMVWQPAISK